MGGWKPHTNGWTDIRVGTTSSLTSQRAKTLVSKLQYAHKDPLSRTLNRQQLESEELSARVWHIIDILANPDVIKTKFGRKMAPSHPTARETANCFEEWNELGYPAQGGGSQTDAPKLFLDVLGTNNKEQEGFIYPIFFEEAQGDLN